MKKVYLLIIVRNYFILYFINKKLTVLNSLFSFIISQTLACLGFICTFTYKGVEDGSS